MFMKSKYSSSFSAILLVVTIQCFAFFSCSVDSTSETREFQISFNSQEADISANPSVMKITDSVSSLSSFPSNPVKAGYQFDGWYSMPEGTGSRCTLSTKFNNDTTLYASWIRIAYTITYHLDGGINSDRNPDSYTIDSPSIFLESPVRENHPFYGWFLDPELSQKTTEIATGTIGNLDLYALWAPIHNVTFNRQIANSSVDISTLQVLDRCSIGSAMPMDPERDGYSFEGWYSGAFGTGLQVLSSTVIETDTYAYAFWKPVEYAISYELAGGVNNPDNPDFYTIESLDIELLPPDYPGYVFDGWYLDESFTKPIQKIEAGSWGSQQLFVKWLLSKPLCVVIEIPVDGLVGYDDSVTIPFGSDLEVKFVEGYAKYIWFLDGGKIGVTTDSGILIASNKLTIGWHNLMLAVENENGDLISDSMTVIVTR